MQWAACTSRMVISFLYNLRWSSYGHQMDYTIYRWCYGYGLQKLWVLGIIERLNPEISRHFPFSVEEPHLCVDSYVSNWNCPNSSLATSSLENQSKWNKYLSTIFELEQLYWYEANVCNIIVDEMRTQIFVRYGKSELQAWKLIIRIARCTTSWYGAYV